MGSDSLAEKNPKAPEFVCSSPNALDFNEKRLRWVSEVREFESSWHQKQEGGLILYIREKRNRLPISSASPPPDFWTFHRLLWSFGDSCQATIHIFILTFDILHWCPCVKVIPGIPSVLFYKKSKLKENRQKEIKGLRNYRVQNC